MNGARLYLAKMDTPVVTPFRYERPLEEFLKSPVKSVEIVHKFFPCDGQRYEERVLYHIEGKDFVVKKLSLQKKDMEFTHTFSAKQLNKVLNELNVGYDAPVKAADFGFTQEDYDSLRHTVFAPKIVDFSIWCDSATKERALMVLPLLDDSVWTDIIQSYNSGRCTSSSTFEITFRNQASQSLVVSCIDDACTYGYFPYMTPFQIQCGGYPFPGTNLSFMHFIGEIKSPTMLDYEFSNFSLLMKAYRYVILHREAFGI